MFSHKVFYLAFVVIGFFIFQPCITAENSPAISFGSYTFQLPATFYIESPPTPDTILFARSKNDAFPTLNILQVAGDYNFSGSELTQLTALVDSYAQVGLTGTKLVSGSLRKNKGFPVLQAHLRYENLQQLFHSKLFIVSDRDKHFIVTFIYPDREHATSGLLYEQIIASLSRNIPPNKVRSISDQAKKMRFIQLTVAACLALLLLIVLGRRFQKKN